jgi:Leucine-rich repeat (LRR) protein
LYYHCNLINRFVSWPVELNVFVNLKELTLTANKISAFADMSGLKSLDTLYMIGNKLTTIGADILYDTL